MAVQLAIELSLLALRQVVRLASPRASAPETFAQPKRQCSSFVPSLCQQLN
jgi:hypothetical protein